MEKQSEKAGKLLKAAKWERIVSIEDAGRRPALCIAVSGESRLYITSDGIITHNTSGHPDSPLPRSYIGRNGRIKVLSTTPKNERSSAAFDAQPVEQALPQFQQIYAEAPQEIRQEAAKVSENLAPQLMSQAEFSNDLKKQAEFLFNEAKARGFSDLSSMFAEAPEQYATLAKQWRIFHQTLEKTGELRNNKASNEIDQKLFGHAFDGPAYAAADALDAAQAFGRGSTEAGEGSESRSATAERTGDSGKTDIAAWAKATGRLINKFPWRLDGPKDIGEGEHHVFYDATSGRYVKLTRGSGGQFGVTLDLRGKKWSIGKANVWQYLNRLSLQNKAFGDDIRLHGVFQDKNGNVNLITSQPDVSGSPLQPGDMDRALTTAGFTSMGDKAWHRAEDNLMLVDMHDGNAVKKDGQVIIFDASTLHPTQKQLQILREQGALKSQGIYSQAALPAPFARLQELEKRAFAQTAGGEARTVGDPRLAHSMDNEYWMAADEYRKATFQRQKEDDWKRMADRMLAEDYTGTFRGILAKTAARETLSPWETKAAEKIVAAEMARPLSGSPDADSRKTQLYTLILGLRETRAETARSLAAFRDPHRTPEERFRAFAGQVIFTPSPKAQKEMEKYMSQAERDSRIATLERRLKAVMEVAQRSQQQEQELSDLRRQVAELSNQPTKEAIAAADASERYERVQSRLQELGLTVEDLMSGTVEVRLMGAKLIGEIASQFNAQERQVIDLSQNKKGGNIADIARRMGIKNAEVERIMQAYQDAMLSQLTERFRNKNANIDQLVLEGVDSSLSSSPSPGERGEQEAREMAERALRMMGFIPVSEYDKTTVRNKRTGKKRASPQPKEIIPMSPWSTPKGEGKPLDVLLERHGMAWENAPKGEGRVTETGKLDLGEGPWETSIFDYKDASQRIQAQRLIQSAAQGATVFDYASELVVANLLSAPVTAITNMTGYLYGAYRFTLRKAIEAAFNPTKAAEAATFGEFRPMFSALAHNLGTALGNAVLAWKTETPITEALRENVQQKLGMSFDEPVGKIPGKLGKVVRLPMRFLLATDEFAKTLLSQAHAATVAYRQGRAQGFEGQRLEAYIRGQMGDPTSNIWDIALQEAQYVTFQSKLRTFQEMDSQEMGTLNKAVHAPEALLSYLTRIKNSAGKDAGIVHNVAAFMLRSAFPFIKTPYNLLYIGMKESYLGAVVDAFRTKGGLGRAERVKGPDILSKEETERKIVAAKKTVKAAKSAEARQAAIQQLKDARSDLERITKRISEDPKKGWLYGKKDMAGAVNARAAIFTTAFLTSLLMAAGEGDDNDDDKWLLITGTTPKGEDKEKGQRELKRRTMPEQSIRIGGKNGIVFSYGRLDPFSVTIATTVDTLSSLKQTAKGRSILEAFSRIGSSAYAQLMDKASLRGFSQIADLISGARGLDVMGIPDILAGWSVPNLVRNLARNTDPLERNSDAFGKDFGARMRYAFLPTAENAPAARRDIYGKPIEKPGNLLTRAFTPGNPHEAKTYAPGDVTLRNWNLQNPTTALSPQTPRLKQIMEHYQATPQQADRILAERGRVFSSLLRENGLMNLRHPTATQADLIKKLYEQAGIAARVSVLGKTEPKKKRV